MKVANKILHNVPIHIREPFIEACFSSSNRSYTKNWILAMFLKPFVVDHWILVSSPSPDGELVVAASMSRGPVAAASSPVRAQARVDGGQGRG
jgi:hypothetical protein